MRIRTFVGLTILGLLVLTGTAGYVYRGYLAPFTPNLAAESGETLLKQLKVPPGFRIHIFADDLPGARSLALSPAGTVFVGSRKEGKVYALVDHNRDFEADQTFTLASGLNMPNGVAFRDENLYVAEVNRILQFPQIESALANPPPPKILPPAYPDDEHHGWKFIRFGPDGWLYVPVGAPCNICKPERDIYATITRMDPRNGAREIYAKGVRNTVGFDWHPDTGELWFTDNGGDWLGDDRPPDELNRAPRAGMHFGFPFCHGANIADPKFGDQGQCSTSTPPAIELGPHVAALGMRFYRGKQFPQRYRNGVFIAEHGSWNRKTPIGYRVMFVGIENNVARSYEVFAEGWLRDGAVSGRPVDILIMPDGSLLVSDDKGGRIYRIVYEG